jgi:uncharacterized membrane protein YoaK (UPF0700 family)
MELSCKSTFPMDRQSLLLSSAIITCLIGVACSSVGPFLLYLLGLVVSALLGLIAYLGLRFKFSSRFQSDRKYPQAASGTNQACAVNPVSLMRQL